MERPASGRTPATLLGVAAIVFWGTTVALARSLTEQLGALRAAGCVYGLCGVISGIYLLARPAGLRAALALPRRYLFGCGGLFVAYMFCLYLGLGLAGGRQQSIEVGTINYSWTAATVIFSVPLLGKRARWTLAPGVLLAVAGIALTASGRGAWAWATFRANLAGDWLPYALALTAGMLWGLYSNLSRRWAAGAGGSAVPLFMIATAAVINLLALLAGGGRAAWTARILLEWLYMGTVPTLLGYVFWDAAMRRGNLVLVASLSYLTPLLSAVVASLYLRAALGPSLWAACGLIVAGAVLCRYSVLERPGAGAAGALDTARGGS